MSALLTKKYFIILLSCCFFGQISFAAARITQDDLNEELTLAMYDGDSEKIKAAILAGANINRTQANPLIYAISRNDIDLIFFLIDHGADIYLQTASGTPEEYARFKKINISELEN